MPTGHTWEYFKVISIFVSMSVKAGLLPATNFLWGYWDHCMNEGLLKAIYSVQTEVQIGEGMFLRKEGSWERRDPEPVSLLDG